MLDLLPPWNLEVVGVIKSLTFDAGFLCVLAIAVAFLCRGRLTRIYRYASFLPWIFFGLVCARGVADRLAQPLFEEARQLERSVEAENCVARARVVVVLGSGIFSDTVPQSPGAQRVSKAASVLKGLAREGRRATVILSGGVTNKGFALSEAEVMADLLEAWLSKSSLSGYHTLVSEGKSLNTAQNAANVRILTQAAGLNGPILLVTSELHLPRATETFRKVGFEVCPVGAPSLEVVTGGFISFGNGVRVVAVLNEYIGRVGYRIFGWL